MDAGERQARQRKRGAQAHPFPRLALRPAWIDADCPGGRVRCRVRAVRDKAVEFDLRQRGRRNRRSAALFGQYRGARRRQGPAQEAGGCVRAEGRRGAAGVGFARADDQGAQRPRATGGGTLCERLLRGRRRYHHRRQVAGRVAARCRVQRAAACSRRRDDPAGAEVRSWQYKVGGRRRRPNGRRLRADCRRGRQFRRRAESRSQDRAGAEGRGPAARQGHRPRDRRRPCDLDAGRDADARCRAGGRLWRDDGRGHAGRGPRLHRLYGGPEARKTLFSRRDRRGARKTSGAGGFQQRHAEGGGQAGRCRKHSHRGAGERTKVPLFRRWWHLFQYRGSRRRGLLGPPQSVRPRRKAAYRRCDQRHRLERYRQAQLQCRHHVRKAWCDRAGVEILRQSENGLRASRRL